VHADLDDLLTALYVLVDDFLPARTGAGSSSSWRVGWQTFSGHLPVRML
jgi:hypothetical protein